VNLQFRFEVFNVTNTPHFANPSGTNVSNLQLNPDGTVRSLNGFGVITSTQTLGREYDERYFRLGMRLAFSACMCTSVTKRLTLRTGESTVDEGFDRFKNMPPSYLTAERAASGAGQWGPRKRAAWSGGWGPPIKQ
jgi:hypothetical protein